MRVGDKLFTVHADDARELLPAGLVASPALLDDEGQQWLADLPQRVSDWCERWSLRIDDATTASHGAHAIVVPVSRHGHSFVLKVSHRGADPRGEVLALRVWSGQGAVRLEEADDSGDVLLLERLDASRTLLACPTGEIGAVAGRLIRELAVPAPAGFTTVHAQADRIAATLQARQDEQGRPLPQGWVREATRLAEQHRNTEDDGLLVHSDLTAGNVLHRRGTRTDARREAAEDDRWVAIDPKPLSGPPERAVPELLWTSVDHCGLEPRDLLGQVVAAGGLDADRARDWVVMRAVDYWLWAESVGLTIDPRRCRRLLESLA